MSQTFDDFAPAGLDAYFVIFTASGNTTPTPASCRQIRDYYQLSMPVLIDPNDVFRDTFDSSRGDNIVMDPNLEVVYRGYHNTTAVQQAIGELLVP